jgi:hypothetical protein
MKLRLLNGSIRIRIQQKELSRLHESGRVDSYTRFGPFHRLDYAILVSDMAAPLRAEYTGSSIDIHVSRDSVNLLVETDRVGVTFDQPIEPGETLHILFEKDFKCLTPRPDEEDAFPHPDEAC